MDKNQIRTLEQISMNAWPSLQTMLYDSWILRFAQGVTRRSNSVNPLYGSRIDIKQKISFCEQLYNKKNLSPIFKITPAIFPHDLDDILSDKGYIKQAETSVQTCDLKKTVFETKPDIIIQEKLEEEWVGSFVELNEFDTEKTKFYFKIFNNIVPEAVYASYRISNQIVGCGLGVKQNDHIGLFDIVVDKEHRGVGLGYL